MTELRGMLRKMKTELAEVVNYTLVARSGRFAVNDLLGSAAAPILYRRD